LPRYLVDTSAWNRSTTVVDRWEFMLQMDELSVCAPVALEVLYSARGPADYRALALELAQVPYVATTDRAARTAADVQAALAERAHHRGPTPIDLLVAAIADATGMTLLHYDRHFDLIQRVTGQPMEWLAPRGSLG
jgi:predicted nucleic acid-binding protein